MPTNHTTPDSHPAATLLTALFASAPGDHYLEIRPLPIRSDTRLFIPLQQLQICGFDGAVPVHLDGQANVYFGICPRKYQGGTADDVELATCLWVDEMRKPWPEGLPRPSALVETSPGKRQAYWILTEPTHDLEEGGGPKPPPGKNGWRG